MKRDVRKALAEEVSKVEETEVAVMLSAGVDSASVMFALIEAGKKVTAYSFTLEHHVSTDFSEARKRAATFDVPFVPVFLPTDLASMKSDMLELRDVGAAYKSQYETGWPMLYVYAKVDQKVVASGLSADNHFCLHKRAMIHYRDKQDEWRKICYDDDWTVRLHTALGNEWGVRHFDPYASQAMIDLFHGASWEDLNKPKQKQPVRESFKEEFSKVKMFDHASYQIGDSNIAQHCADTLLASDWNVRNAKSVVTVYNDITKGRVK